MVREGAPLPGRPGPLCPSLQGCAATRAPTRFYCCSPQRRAYPPRAATACSRARGGAGQASGLPVALCEARDGGAAVPQSLGQLRGWPSRGGRVPGLAGRQPLPRGCVSVSGWEGRLPLAETHSSPDTLCRGGSESASQKGQALPAAPVRQSRGSVPDTLSLREPGAVPGKPGWLPWGREAGGRGSPASGGKGAWSLVGVCGPSAGDSSAPGRRVCALVGGP